MRTNERLDQALRTAKVVDFDSTSKFVFFSDVHRGDDSVSDEFTKNQTTFLHALDYYYENGFTYIEVGDGEDLWEYGDFKVIRLAHAEVYDKMRDFFRDGRLYIIYGNHNNKLKNKAYVKKNLDHCCNEFNESCECLYPHIDVLQSILLRDKENGHSFLVVHGHQGDLFNDQLWFVSRFLLHYIWRYFHVIGLHSPTSPAKVLYKRHRIEANFEKWIRLRRQAVICGHTHRPRFPRKSRVPYFNTGASTFSKGITGIEIVDGKIQMIEWRDRANPETGVVEVKRAITKGPRVI